MDRVFTSQAELVTALTDLLLCLVALVLCIAATRHCRAAPVRRRLNVLLLFLLALNGLGGFMMHGLTVFLRCPRLYRIGWDTLAVLLYSLNVPVTAAFFGELWGRRAAVCTFWVLLGSWVVVSVVSCLTGSVAANGLALLYACSAVCVVLCFVLGVAAVLRGKRSAIWQTAGIALAACGGAVLIFLPESTVYRCVIPFSPAGISHLFFLAFLAFYYVGYVRGAPEHRPQL